ncbi:MAG: hypothetical protein GY811_25760 [Myxococcales bacterium]|nr:hypothetical protein [Myxococcales bacterium]
MDTEIPLYQLSCSACRAIFFVCRLPRPGVLLRDVPGRSTARGRIGDAASRDALRAASTDASSLVRATAKVAMGKVR